MGSRLESNSTNVRKRIENHTFDDEGGEEYEASKFGGFTDYMRRKKLKLQNLDVELRSQSLDKPQIFKGVVAHVNGYTQPSLSDLHKLIVTYGGGFLQYLDGKTVATHVIASNLTPKKKVEFARYRIVKPAWVVDSVNAGKLLPWDAYRVVDEGPSQKVIGFDGGRVVSRANTLQKGYRDQTESSWYTSQLQKNQNASQQVYDDADDLHTLGFRNGQVSEPHLSSSSEADALPRSSTQRDLSFLADQLTAEDDVLAGIEGDQPRNSVGPTSVSGLDADRIEHNERAELQSPLIEDETNTGAQANHNHTPKTPTSVTETRQSPRQVNSSSPEKRKLTAEEHNARLLSDPHLAKSSTANPDFLKQYYRESRLHHLSTWKAELKAQLQSLAAEQTSSQEARQTRRPGARRYIIHVDFDSFFAAVSLRKHPELAEKPVVIAHGNGPGSEIASCNYPARKFGIKNGAWMKSALQLCPDLKVLPYDFKAYEEASRLFYEAIVGTEGVVQSVSIDEALVDISNRCIAAGGSDGKSVSDGSLELEQAKADQISHDLRTLIRERTGCEVSIGIGNNILLAKVALRKAKPAGQHQIRPEEILDFIGELSVQDLPGVAYSLGGKLEEIGVKFVKDIRNLTKERLSSSLGPKTGEKLWDYSRGIDRTEVGDQVVRKSVSAEVNWGIRFVTQQQADEFVQCMCDELNRRLLEQGLKGRQLTMKIMKRSADAPLDPPKSLGHGKCDTYNKSVILGVATNDKAVIGKEALSILRGFGFSPGELRGLGIQMQKLEPLKAPQSVVNLDSSQRRLQFKQPSSAASQSSKRPSSASKPRKIQDYGDPIERSPTPEEKESEVIQGAIPHARPDATEKTYRPLNLAGTQFILPSQIDPTVLAELPTDIRAKLQTQPKRVLDALKEDEIDPRSRSGSPSVPFTDLPNQSQIDPETLDALPEDVREEILAHYAAGGSRHRSGPHLPQQQLLPQSPRKPRPVLSSKKLATTEPKSLKPKLKSTTRGRPPKSKSTITATKPMIPTLTQANFVTGATSSRPPISPTSSPTRAIPEEISESFLSALPEDLRAEILADQRRQRLQARSGLTWNQQARNKKDSGGGGGAIDWNSRKRVVKLPKREPRPTFTSRKLSTVEELRSALEEWVREFSGPRAPAEETAAGDAGTEDEAEENPDGEKSEEPLGPYPEDVDALASYLAKVITVERDLDKAETLVRWLEWLLGEMDEQVVTGDSKNVEDSNETEHGMGSVRQVWTKVVQRLWDAVDDAICERGGKKH